MRHEHRPTERAAGGRPDAEQQHECLRQQARALWDELPEILTPQEVCRALRVSRTACYEGLRHGCLGGIAFKWGRTYRIPKK